MGLMSAMTASTPRLPSDKTPETITLEEAAALVDARADRGPAPHARPRKAPRAAGGAARTGKRAASKVSAAKAAAPKKPPASTAKTRKKTQQAAE